MADRFIKAQGQTQWSKAGAPEKDRFISDLREKSPKFLVFDETLTLGATDAVTTTIESVTITGVKANDMVIGWKHGSGNLDTDNEAAVMDVWVSADNTVKIQINNQSASSITPTASTLWTIMVCRMGA